MNRAERRRLEKAKSRVHILTHDEEMYEKGFKAGHEQGLKDESGMTTRLFTSAMVAMLINEFGFGEQRIKRALVHVQATLESIRDDLEHEKKIRTWIKKRTGIDLDDYTGGRDIDIRNEMQSMYDMGKVITARDKKLAESIVKEIERKEGEENV